MFCSSNFLLWCMSLLHTLARWVRSCNWLAVLQMNLHLIVKIRILYENDWTFCFNFFFYWTVLDVLWTGQEALTYLYVITVSTYYVPMLQTSNFSLKCVWFKFLLQSLCCKTVVIRTVKFYHFTTNFVLFASRLYIIV